MRAVNLIPAEQRSGGGTGAVGESQAALYILIGTLAVVAVLVVLYGSARHQVASKRSEVASLNAQAQAVEAQANRLAPYKSFVTLHNERIQALSTLVGTRFDWAHAFHELGRVLPADVSLTSVQGTVGGSGASGGGPAPSSPAASAAVASATPPGSLPTLTLTGCTTSQSQVAVALARLRLIDGVSSVKLQSSVKSTGSGTGGACGPNAPVFTAQVSFTALPLPGQTYPAAGATTPVASTSTSMPPARGRTPAASTQSPAGTQARRPVKRSAPITNPRATTASNKTTNGKGSR